MKTPDLQSPFIQKGHSYYPSIPLPEPAKGNPGSAVPVETPSPAPLKPPANVETEFLGPGKNSEYSDIFIKDGSTSGPITSVNAGDPDLYVGGATINYSFSLSVNKKDEFQPLHRHLLTQSPPGEVRHFTQPDHTSTVQFSTVLKSDFSGKKQK